MKHSKATLVSLVKTTMVLSIILLFSSSLRAQTFKSFAKDFMDNAGANLESFKSYSASKIIMNDCGAGNKKISVSKAFKILKETLINADYKIDSKNYEIRIYIDKIYKYNEVLSFKEIEGEWKLYYFGFPC